MAEAKIHHHLRMENPHKHYFQVETQFEISAAMLAAGEAQIKMAVWTPGSYLVREYAKNVENVKAKAGNKGLNIQKISKNTWAIPLKNLKKGDFISVSYDVYAFEPSVRTSILDDSHGYINPASVFMYIDEFKTSPIELTIHPYAGFSKSSSAMRVLEEHHFLANSLDEFIDSPIEIGNHETFLINVQGIPHEVAFYGPADVDRTKLAADMQKLCTTAAQVVGAHPCDHYLFIIHNYQRGGGGLEHLNSTTCEVSRAEYETEAGYKGILNLLAHEYFHLWNVKRIRPIALGPFDYENENYTHHLWFSEGLTSYYANLITFRAGFISEQEFLDETASNIAAVESQPGNKVQSAAESSFDAWIKYYRPNENSRNSTISYYSKGEILGTYLNLWIILNSEAKKSLDDVLKYLYQNYYLDKNRGFTDSELVEAFSKVAGKPANELFEKYIFGLDWPNYADLFKQFGYQLIDKNAGNQDPYLGVYVNNDQILSLSRNSPAENAGLSVNDKIKDIDGKSWTNFNKEISNYRPGLKVLVNIIRDGLERNFTIQIGNNPNLKYELNPESLVNANQIKLKNYWLKK